jgi:hypothetical protein
MISNFKFPVGSCVAFIVFIATSLGSTTLSDLLSFGSSSYAIVPEVSIGTYTQDATGTKFSPPMLGDTLGGTFEAQDWSAYSSLESAVYIKIAFEGSNPVLPVSLILFDPTFESFNFYQGWTAPILEHPGYFKLELVSATAGLLDSVGGAQFTWDGGATVNATLQGLAAANMVADNSWAWRVPSSQGNTFADSAGNGNFNAASPVERTLVVSLPSLPQP